MILLSFSETREVDVTFIGHRYEQTLQITCELTDVSLLSSEKVSNFIQSTSSGLYQFSATIPVTSVCVCHYHGFKAKL